MKIDIINNSTELLKNVPFGTVFCCSRGFLMKLDGTNAGIERKESDCLVADLNTGITVCMTEDAVVHVVGARLVIGE